MFGFGGIAKRIFGSSNDRYVKSLGPLVKQINALEPTIAALSDDDLRAQTEKFRARLAAGEKLDALLPEAFATVREASKRTLGQRHYDVQMIGGIVLHRGEIAEMRTGEGKTLVATLACYLNALTGEGVHVVTVNDYLARRDSEWMGQIYKFLGMSVGVIVPNIDDDSRRAAYACAVTYASNKELAFDYLRDRSALGDHASPLHLAVQSLGSQRAQGDAEPVLRGLVFAIVDEADSVLLDEAMTPATDFVTEVVEQMVERGFILNRIGRAGNTLKIRPPMPFSVENADMLIDALQDVLAETQGRQ